MKLNDLKKAAAKAQQDLQFVELKVAELQQKAKVAKAKSEQTRLMHKSARKSAKQAKKLASTAEDQARDKSRALEKSRKRLTKALKKLGQGKSKPKGKPAKPSAVAHPSAPSRRAPKKQPAVTPTPPRPSAGRQTLSAAPGSVTSPTVIPAD